MSNIAYLRQSDNWITTQSAIKSVSSTGSGYQFDFANRLPISKPWRSGAAPSYFYGDINGYEYLFLNLGSVLQPTVIALINHNIAPTSTVTLIGGNASTIDGLIDAPLFSTTISYRAGDMFKVIAPGGYQYWAIKISGAAAYWQIGMVMMGTLTTLAFNFAHDWRIEHLYESRLVESEFGTPHAVTLYSRLGLGLDFRALTKTEADTLIAALDPLVRDSSPILILPDAAGTDCYFVRSMNDINETIGPFRDVNDIAFVEDIRGRSIAA